MGNFKSLIKWKLLLPRIMFEKVWYTFRNVYEAIDYSDIFQASKEIWIYTGCMQNERYYENPKVLQSLGAAILNGSEIHMIFGSELAQAGARFIETIKPAANIYQRLRYDQGHFKIFNVDGRKMCILDEPHQEEKGCIKSMLLFKGFDLEVYDLLRKFNKTIKQCTKL